MGQENGVPFRRREGFIVEGAVQRRAQIAGIPGLAFAVRGILCVEQAVVADHQCTVPADIQHLPLNGLHAVSHVAVLLIAAESDMTAHADGTGVCGGRCSGCGIPAGGSVRRVLLFLLFLSRNAEAYGFFNQLFVRVVIGYRYLHFHLLGSQDRLFRAGVVTVCKDQGAQLVLRMRFKRLPVSVTLDTVNLHFMKIDIKVVSGIVAPVEGKHEIRGCIAFARKKDLREHNFDSVLVDHLFRYFQLRLCRDAAKDHHQGHCQRDCLFHGLSLLIECFRLRRLFIPGFSPCQTEDLPKSSR